MSSDKNTILSFQVSKKLTDLVKGEVISGNFTSKSEFIRYLMLQWFEKNHPEKIKTES